MKTETKFNGKIFWKFIGIVLLSAIAGVLVSSAFFFFTGGEIPDTSKIVRVLCLSAGVLLVVLNILCPIVAFRLTSRCKKAAKAWDGKDDGYMDRLEKQLDTPMNIANIMTVINFLLFPLSVETSFLDALSSPLSLILVPLSLLFFIFGFVWIIVVTHRVVKLIQELNPEKRGNILDIEFHKDWMASLDEAQKQQSYQCGFVAYRTGSNACMIAWLLAVLGSMLMNTGIFPILLVCSIWLAMVIRYTVENHRLEHRK